MSTRIKWFSALMIASLFLSTPISVYAAGKFLFTVLRTHDKADEKLADYMESKGTFSKIIDALNQTLIIPYDIHIIMTNSKRGPHYEYARKLIVLDFGDERWSAAQYDKNYPNSTATARQYYLNNINLFSFYHELGHALIDAYQIPIVAEEEDSADSLAAVMILYYFDQGAQILLDNADYFDLARRAGASEENQYWDVHALNPQRYYRLLCYAYGQSPKFVEYKLKKTDEQRKDKTLTTFLSERKDQCIYEYKRLNASWFTILKSHFTDSTKADEAIKRINNNNPENDEDNKNK